MEEQAAKAALFAELRVAFPAAASAGTLARTRALCTLVAEGALGRKTGRGFHTYEA